jgi:CRISPR/Cas system CSM-associated protein Csm3 (group 7 of RAMP superfamily)
MAQHIYFRIVYALTSPMAIGSGNNESTDSDVVTDSCGNPYIPASSAAGVMRSYADEKLQKEMFGEIGEHSRKSRIIIYDAVQTKSSFTTVRDCVKLEKRVAADGAKFDFEAVETGAEFTGYIELDKNACEYEENVIDMLSAMNSGVLRFGAKTSSGYGQVKIADVKKAAFDLDNDSELTKWLDFDMFDSSCWKSENVQEVELFPESHDNTVIKLELELKSALSVRKYTTENKAKNESSPDYTFTSLNDGRPVIPGTSWRGAFRSRFAEFAGDENRVNELFGFVCEKTNDSCKSDIVFGESIITDFTSKAVTRNSVDRFSGATKDGALYTEETCYNGKTGLTFMIGRSWDEKSRNILAACIADLDKGYLAVGGLTSVGRGIFAVQKLVVDGIDRTAGLKSGQLKGLLSGGNK